MDAKQAAKLSRGTRQNIVLFVLLVVLMIFFTIQNPKFSSFYNIMNIVRQNVPNYIIACAMMFVIASGAIDLSVGGVMAFSAVFYGYLCIWGINPWFALIIIVLFGVVMGSINTVITEKLQIPAIMSTMATWLISAGMALTICKAIPISDDLVKPITILNRLKLKIPGVGNVPIALFIVLVVVVGFLFLEKKTIVGKYAIAIGGNSNAAHFSGINVTKMRLIFFVLCSVMASLAGVWQVARLGSADPKIGNAMEFSVISSCILGGVNIKGGEGSIIGVVLGTSILAILTNGMQMMDIQAFFQQVVIGVVLLAAVLINYAFSHIKFKKAAAQPTQA